ncbi:hypothetical protein FACS18942_00740 [Planctomycetales bacterium]|nr:hypothetical protein FACS18942_00740 [Planctomycetales bacterium]GHT34620.1 hypothetical protein FACS189427_02250 [Planctomycetales bacterium]
MLPIIGYHIVISTYGFWLPNDPRGSGSNRVWSPQLQKFGEATKVHTTHSVAHLAQTPAAWANNREAKTELKYPAVIFDGKQALAVVKGFEKAIADGGYDVFACSIMPEHVHLVCGTIPYNIVQVVRLLKQRATQELTAQGLHPNVHAVGVRANCKLPPVWGENFWKRFIYDENDLSDTIRYVENNPVKEGKKPQRWSFVKQLD